MKLSTIKICIFFWCQIIVRFIAHRLIITDWIVNIWTTFIENITFSKAFKMTWNLNYYLYAKHEIEEHRFIVIGPSTVGYRLSTIRYNVYYFDWNRKAYAHTKLCRTTAFTNFIFKTIIYCCSEKMQWNEKHRFWLALNLLLKIHSIYKANNNWNIDQRSIGIYAIIFIRYDVITSRIQSISRCIYFYRYIMCCKFRSTIVEYWW